MKGACVALADTISPPVQGADFVRPFGIVKTQVSGQAVRLEKALKIILDQHQYPDVINALLSELIVMAAALSGTFKFEGITTLQIKGDGVLDTMVCDVNHVGHLRAYATFDLKRASHVSMDHEDLFRALVGNGYLLMTADPENSERYQGIVELKGETLSACFEHYFLQSAQCPTMIRLAVMPPSMREPALEEQDSQHGAFFGWRAGAIVVQQLLSSSAEASNDWHGVSTLLGTATPQELVGKEISVDDLLYRLFHEYGVRVHEVVPLEARCRCSQKKVEDALAVAMGDKEESLDVTCVFCGCVYRVCFSVCVSK